jgi:hypothetical protein
MALTHTKFSSHGKILFTQELCGPETLDARSTKALREIENILDASRGKVMK